jgi:RND family efflux transporter MFP subunit
MLTGKFNDAQGAVPVRYAASMSDRLSQDLASLRIDRDASAPPSGRMKLVVILLLVAALGVGAYAFVVPLIRSKLLKTEVAVTEIAMVSPAQAQINFTSTGYVIPETISQVSAKVGGRVAEVKVRQGDTVKAGDVLLVLDAIDQESALRAARARVSAAQAAAQTARAQVVEAQNQAKLASDMAAQGVGATSAAVDAKARVASLQAAVKAADAQARAVSQEAASMQVDLKNYTLVAPIGGTVLNKPPELGEMVGPTFGGVASALGGIEIADFDSLVVESDVAEARLHMVEPGGPCEVILDAFPDNRYGCKVKEVLPRVNRAKATVPVKVSFTEKVPRALPDMSARVSFMTKELDAASRKEPPKKVVPRAAVVERNGGKVVFTVIDHRVRMVAVTLGAELGDGWVLVQGPDAGTKLVSDPPEDLADGQEIEERGGE